MNNKSHAFKFCVVVCTSTPMDGTTDFIFDGKGYTFVEYHPCKDSKDMKDAYLRIQRKYKASKRFKVIATHQMAIDAVTAAIGFAEVTKRIEDYEVQKQKLQKEGTSNERPI